MPSALLAKRSAKEIAVMTFNDTFEALFFAIPRALNSRRESDWMGSSTTGIGSVPPINIFSPGHYPLLRGQSMVARTIAQTMPQLIHVMFG